MRWKDRDLRVEDVSEMTTSRRNDDFKEMMFKLRQEGSGKSYPLKTRRKLSHRKGRAHGDAQRQERAWGFSELHVISYIAMYIDGGFPGGLVARLLCSHC